MVFSDGRPAFFHRVLQLDEINDEDCFSGMVLSVSEMAELMLWMYPEYLPAGYAWVRDAIKQIRHGRAYGPSADVIIAFGRLK